MDTEHGARRFRRGQAMMEMAMGMFALALVLSALFGFCAFIVRDLEIQRDLRARAGRSAMGSTGVGFYGSASDTDSVEVSDFGAKYIFGSNTLTIREEVHIPAMGGVNPQ